MNPTVGWSKKILEPQRNSDNSLPFGAVSYHVKYFFKIRTVRFAPTRFKILKF